jgi:hypothetical protein
MRTATSGRVATAGAARRAVLGRAAGSASRRTARSPADRGEPTSGSAATGPTRHLCGTTDTSGLAISVYTSGPTATGSGLTIDANPTAIATLGIGR